MGKVSRVQAHRKGAEERAGDGGRMAYKNVLNIHEAAELLCRSEKTIRNRLHDIPHYYGGVGLVFRRDELEAWMCQVKCKPLSI